VPPAGDPEEAMTSPNQESRLGGGGNQGSHHYCCCCLSQRLAHWLGLDVQGTSEHQVVDPDLQQHYGLHSETNNREVHSS
jgi:hypothetical protein